MARNKDSRFEVEISGLSPEQAKALRKALSEIEGVSNVEESSEIDLTSEFSAPTGRQSDLMIANLTSFLLVESMVTITVGLIKLGMVLAVVGAVRQVVSSAVNKGRRVNIKVKHGMTSAQINIGAVPVQKASKPSAARKKRPVIQPRKKK